MNKATMVLVLLLTVAAGVAAAEWKANIGGGPASAAALACSADGKTVYAADTKQVWKSEDGGAHWKSVTPKEE